MWSGYFFLGVKQEWDKNLLLLLTMVVVIVNVVHMLVLLGSMCFETCKENKESKVLQSIRKRSLQMVPTRIKKYHDKRKSRQTKPGHRLSFDFENPALDQVPASIELTERESTNVNSVGNMLRETRVMRKIFT